jgi:hypothetical protein
MAKKKIVKVPPAKSKLKPKKRPSKTKATAKKPAAPKAITHEMIVARAHAIWLKKNHAHHTNSEVQNWHEAEAELRGSSGK